MGRADLVNLQIRSRRVMYSMQPTYHHEYRVGHFRALQSKRRLHQTHILLIFNAQMCGMHKPWTFGTTCSGKSSFQRCHARGDVAPVLETEGHVPVRQCTRARFSTPGVGCRLPAGPACRGHRRPWIPRSRRTRGGSSEQHEPCKIARHTQLSELGTCQGDTEKSPSEQKKICGRLATE